MVIVISRYVDNYSNNSLKIDTEFLINLPMQHLGFTDIGSSFPSSTLGFCRVLQAVLCYSLQYLPAVKIATTLYIFLWHNYFHLMYLDHLVITCPQWTSNWQHIAVVCTFKAPFPPFNFLTSIFLFIVTIVKNKLSILASRESCCDQCIYKTRCTFDAHWYNVPTVLVLNIPTVFPSFTFVDVL